MVAGDWLSDAVVGYQLSVISIYMDIPWILHVVCRSG